MGKKQFAVIGMGRFGSSVATSLMQLGYDVLAIDRSEQIIQDVSDWATHAVAADTTDEDTLRSLAIWNFDVVVVAIGADIQASILTALILKELGVKQVIVKAQNELHGKVLSKIGADKIVFPERDMGIRLAHNLVSPNILEFIELSKEYSIVELKAPAEVVGKTLKQLDIRANYRCNVLAIKSGADLNIAPFDDDWVEKDDVLVIAGRSKDISKLELDYAEG
ncbi:trk system potassium uptake protein TrkA [Paenibacillus taihuensis]|uniref:Trk system potassium uptake protein TrkA n=1 Tax=Paenibacillus taihuensis TaxID=1156355 RepID=A0A3D9SFG2_9BACL|nr:TrkA family potassium uptake protein [Paenibacillus taihuensis]REE87487.1 trk system potassium uptake protein TrkA [Paenibacillus taihuensis]